ncbi:MAG TPA: hypothetical protein VG796_07390 [Verrucomicrobiales bacterium]|nr:hypothetical protein [Verrucomicrobiales bacterium]
MGNKNGKATKEEKAHARRVIREAFPDLVAVFGAHGDYGGHRAPRDHTIVFRLQNERRSVLLQCGLDFAGGSRWIDGLQHASDGV